MSSREEILEELKTVIAPFMNNKALLGTITENTDLLKDLGINSANLVDIIIEAESQYDIEIDADAAERISTVGSCIDVIQEKIGAKHGE